MGKRGRGFLFSSKFYSKEEAIAQFVSVEKFTERNNRMVPYTAYEYDGKRFIQLFIEALLMKVNLTIIEF